jgi:hypothetical protein
MCDMIFLRFWDEFLKCAWTAEFLACHGAEWSSDNIMGLKSEEAELKARPSYEIYD